MAVRRRRERPAGGGKPGWLINFRHPAAPGGRFYKTVPGELARRDAEKLEREARAELDRQEGRRHSPATVRDTLNRYWLEHGQHLASWKTERGHLDTWDATLAGDDTPIEAVTVAEISGAVARWRSQPAVPTGRKAPILVKPSTINHRLAALQRVWRRAEDLWGYRLARIPWGRLKLDEPDYRDRSLRADDLEAFIAAMPERSRYITLLALFTGLRRGAVLGLVRADIDWQRGIIHAASKGRAGGKPTPIPMTGPVLAAFQAMGALPECGRIFRVTADQLRGDRERARQAAGLPDMRFHDLRHTFAQALEDAGLGDTITDALHHSTPALRRRYARARLERTRAAAEAAFRPRR